MDIWKIFKIKKGVYTKELDKKFDEFFNGNYAKSNREFEDLCLALVNYGDYTQYAWKYKSKIIRLDAKLKTYDIKVTRKKDKVNITIKKLSEKELIAKIVSEKV